MKEKEITKVLDALIEKEITYDEAKDKLFVLYGVSNSEADVCPECGYPKIKKHHEDFERCNGCDWTSK